jgi:hypothetical protein
MIYINFKLQKKLVKNSIIFSKLWIQVIPSNLDVIYVLYYHWIWLCKRKIKTSCWKWWRRQVIEENLKWKLMANNERLENLHKKAIEKCWIVWHCFKHNKWWDLDATFTSLSWSKSTILQISNILNCSHFFLRSYCVTMILMIPTCTMMNLITRKVIYDFQCMFFISLHSKHFHMKHGYWLAWVHIVPIAKILYSRNFH